MKEKELTKKAAERAISDVKQKAMEEALTTLDEEDLIRRRENERFKKLVEFQKTELE